MANEGTLHGRPGAAVPEDVFRQLAEASPDAILVVDDDETIRYANRALARLFGYERDDLIGRPIGLLQSEHLRASGETAMQRYQQGRSPGSWGAFATVGRSRDGKEFPVEVTFMDLPADGHRRFAGFVHDMTRHRRAERKLVEAEQRLESILDSMKDVVWSAAPGGPMLYLNPAVETLFGRKREEFLADPKLWFRATHADDRALAAQLAKDVLERGSIDAQYRIVHASGEVRHIRSRARLIRDDAGRPARIDGVVTDVTDMHRHQERILRLSRMHAVLSGIGALTVRERDRQALLEGACRIAVEAGQLKLAWIGQVRPDGEIVPVASHGANPRFFAAAAEYLRADRSHAGPTARAVAEKRPVVVNDFAAEPSLVPVRDAALVAGLLALASLPLIVQGEVTGCVTLYAGEKGFFDEEEMGALQQLASDLSYALEFIAHEDQLRFASSYDAVTGLANRRLFLERLGQMVDSARQKGRTLAVIALDLAHFKSINDTFGHVAGDNVLWQAGTRLARFAGGAGHVARMSGDHFAAFVPDLAQAEDVARALQDRAGEALSRPVTVAGTEVQLSARVGIAVFPGDGDDAAALFRNAEAALKRAKESGERYLFYRPEMTSAVAEKLKVETQMRRALERGEFLLHYQPKVDLRSGRITGAEALLRWNSPERGLVMPLEFVPVLEETGLIMDVGRWVMRQAAADHRAWKAAGLPSLPVAVNVSALQLRQNDFVDGVLDAVQIADGSGPGLELEVTESMLMEHMDPSVEKLTRLRDHGVPTAIDDFGTGYSSLAYLARLPVAAVKIDRSFVLTMARSSNTMAIVSAIAALARSMDLKVIAEGVDAPDQLNYLRLLRCDEMQGFLFSKPLPVEDFVALVRSGRTLG